MGVAISAMVVVAVVALGLAAWWSWRTRQLVLASYQSDNRLSNTRCPRPETAVDITALPCCVVAGITTSLRYEPSIDMIVSPQPVFPLNACAGFCVNGLNEQGNACLGAQGAEQFTACLSRTQPVGCTTTAQPVAFIGATNFYGYAATQQSCTVTRPCSAITVS